MKLFIYAFLAIIVLVGISCAYPYGTSFTKDVTVEDFEATKGTSGNKYLFFDSNGNTYQVGDCLMRGHFSSTDVFFTIKKLKGKRINVTGYGWRIPLLSWYPNVVRINRSYDNQDN